MCKCATPFYGLSALSGGIAADMQFAADTRSGASALESAVDNLIVYAYYGADRTSHNAGLSVFVSCDDFVSGRPMFCSHCWYNANDASVRGASCAAKYQGELLWCVDRQSDDADLVDNWFELMDAWYDPDGNGPDGGCNAYRY